MTSIKKIGYKIDMNILVFSWRDPRHPLAGGAEQVMHEHMKGWVNTGHKVTLFSSKMTGLQTKEILDGVEIVRSGYQYCGVQFAGFFYYLKNKSNIDFIVDQFHGIPFFTPIYSNKPKLAVIQEPAREVWLKNPLPFPLNWLIGIVGYISEPFIFWFYKNIKFMTGSESAKQELIKLGISRDKIVVIPHGVIVKKPKLFPKKEKIPTIIYLGLLSKDKGIEDAIHCFHILDKKGKFKFWIIGKPETQNYFFEISRLVKNLNLEKKIKFWGFVSQEKKFELLARAHIMINPSIREGWGLVNIEANSVGLPVVGYKSPGLVDSIKDGINGVIVGEKSPKYLAETVNKVLRNQNLYRKLSLGAKGWSKNFSWEKSIKKSLTLVTSIVTVRR